MLATSSYDRIKAEVMRLATGECGNESTAKPVKVPQGTKKPKLQLTGAWTPDEISILEGARVGFGFRC